MYKEVLVGEIAPICEYFMNNCFDIIGVESFIVNGGAVYKFITTHYEHNGRETITKFKVSPDFSYEIIMQKVSE